MKAIFGVGNPGLRYLNTRHNIGFIILEKFALRYNIEFNSSTEDYFYSANTLGTSHYLLIKPTTYVNLSGLAAKRIIDEYNVSLNDFLVVADDLNLNFGNIRIRTSGGDGGHKGLNSIIYHLQTEDFPRLRFGIGNEFEDGEMKDFVLTHFDNDILEQLEPQFDHAINLIDEFIKGDIKSMLDYYSTMAQQQNSNKSNNQEGKQEV